MSLLKEGLPSPLFRVHRQRYRTSDSNKHVNI